MTDDQYRLMVAFKDYIIGHMTEDLLTGEGVYQQIIDDLNNSDCLKFLRLDKNTGFKTEGTSRHWCVDEEDVKYVGDFSSDKYAALINTPTIENFRPIFEEHLKDEILDTGTLMFDL